MKKKAFVFDMKVIEIAKANDGWGPLTFETCHKCQGNGAICIGYIWKEELKSSSEKKCAKVGND